MSTTTHLEYPHELKEQAKALLESLTPAQPPLRLADGVLRVGSTRIPLDRVIYDFNTGCTAEQILDDFPTLNLTDIYALITYYLWHREAVDAYLEKRQQFEEEVRREIEAEEPYAKIRERLLARRASKA
jgi:uncharacterized protein (DUF433 family)